MTQLLWDLGTAYDLFISLEILHNPEEYDIPGSWPAGMRARLPAAEREILEQSQFLIHHPFHWIYTLPEPKDAAAVIWTLSRVPAAERLPLLAIGPDAHLENLGRILRPVAERGAWDDKDREALHAANQSHRKSARKRAPYSADETLVLDWWAHPAEFGERYLRGLRAYQEVFFAEEENRIRPALQEASAHAKELASRLPLPDLLEELSQGLRLGEPLQAPELVLAFSYWTTPLVYLGKVASERDIWVLGARPANASIVPGQVVSDAMLRALKALSDPTRLRILHHLTEEKMTPAMLARHLRLRAPTVLHHLQILRLAGLVQVTLVQDGESKTYATRPEAVAATFSALNRFLGKPDSGS